jgi:hypothetical protein
VTHWRGSTAQTAVALRAHVASAGSSTTTPRRSSRVLDTWELLGYPVELIVRHFERRLFELAVSVIMVGEGTLLFLSPDSLSAGAFRFLTDWLQPQSCVLLLLLFGFARVLALALNGNWMPYGGWIRAIGAGVGAVMWTQMGLALSLFSKRTGVPLPPGFPMFMVLALFEIVSIYRALHGIRRWREYGTSD